MIHFQCRCGTTLSADEKSAGSGVRCAACGADLKVPAAARTPSKLRAAGRKDSGRHDFDAEITAAARSAPTRPKKTPRRVETPTGDPVAPPPEPGEVPSYDLIGVGTWAERLGPLSVLVLLALVVAAGAAWALVDAGTPLRAVAAGVLVLLGLITFVALRILREVCRSVIGLADRQRESTAEVLRGKSGG